MIYYTTIVPDQLGMYQKALENFEREFTYLLGDDRYVLSHGRDYGAFFKSLGQCSIILVQQALSEPQDTDPIIGCIALIKKQCSWHSQLYPALYIGDLKIKKEHQLTGLSTQLFKQARELIVSQMLVDRQTLVYFVALQTPKGGDFTTIKSACSPLHLFSPLAAVKFFMVPPYLLICLPDRAIDEPLVSEDLLNLSPDALSSTSLVNGCVYLTGIRDFIKPGTSIPCKVAHIAFGATTGSQLIKTLRGAAHQAYNHHDDLCCFALDTRRTDILQFLAQHGIATQTIAKVYGHALQSQLQAKQPIVALGTYQL
jgi:hypothetical protein